MQGLEKRGYFFRFIGKCTILYKDKKKTTRISPKGFMTLETFSKQNKKKFATQQKKRKLSSLTKRTHIFKK